MKWYYVFIKSLREQVRDYWILVLTLVFAPLFVFMYYLMSETGIPTYHVILINQDKTIVYHEREHNMGDTLVHYLRLFAGNEKNIMLNYSVSESREAGLSMLAEGDADVMVVLPPSLSSILLEKSGARSQSNANRRTAILELAGDITDLNYIVGAVWTEELVNRFILESAGVHLPFEWKETTLGHSGKRSEFELYVPGLMIFSIIMMMFTASASLVREPEAGTLERLKISNLTALQYLAGISLIQVLIGIVSLLLTISTAVLLGYRIIPGSFWFIMGIGFLTSLSMISFSLIVAAMCRSIKDVAVIGTFPLMLLMFFSGAFFPLNGGRILSTSSFTLHLNDFLSPTWAVDALNKVLIKGLDVSSTLPDILAILTLSIIYFIIGVWAFKLRHMKVA